MQLCKGLLQFKQLYLNLRPDIKKSLDLQSTHSRDVPSIMLIDNINKVLDQFTSGDKTLLFPVSMLLFIVFSGFLFTVQIFSEVDGQRHRNLQIEKKIHVQIVDSFQNTIHNHEFAKALNISLAAQHIVKRYRISEKSLCTRYKTLHLCVCIHTYKHTHNELDVQQVITDRDGHV